MQRDLPTQMSQDFGVRYPQVVPHPARAGRTALGYEVACSHQLSRTGCRNEMMLPKWLPNRSPQRMIRGQEWNFVRPLVNMA